MYYNYNKASKLDLWRKNGDFDDQTLHLVASIFLIFTQIHQMQISVNRNFIWVCKFQQCKFTKRHSRLAAKFRFMIVEFCVFICKTTAPLFD